MSPTPAIQDLAHADGICYGCGPAHPTGLHIKSHWDGDGVHVVSRFTPDEQFVGWPGLLYGGLIAMLVDCHSNWTAMAYHLRAEQADGKDPTAINCVTGELGIKYIKPTPMGVELTLRARVDGPLGRKSRIICEIYAGDVLTAIGDSIFVRVDAGKLAEQAHGREA